MTAIRFTGVHAELAAEVAAERGREVVPDAGIVVDTDAWGLAEPVGICAEEACELRAAVERRVDELP